MPNTGPTSETFSIRSITRWDLFALVLPVLAISQLLYGQASLLWAKQHMQFFPLAFAATAWFFVQEGNADFAASNRRSRIAIAIAITGILLCYATLAMQSSWLANFALIALVFAWSLGKFGNLTVIRIIGICGLMVVALPPPFDLDRYMVQGLQSLSTIISTRILDITHFVHFRAGNVIEIPSKSLFVEEACSGVDSQYALMAVAGTLLLLGRAGLFVSLVTIVTVPIWAILGNLLRINSIVLGLECFGVDLSSGMKHTILGLLTFSLAAWAHWSSVQFLNMVAMYCSKQPSPDGWNNNLSGNFSQPEANRVSFRPSNTVSGWALILPALLLLASVFGSFGAVFNWTRKHEFQPDFTSEVASLLPAERDLPKISHGRERTSFSTYDREIGDIFGRHSRVWTYSGEKTNQLVSLDLPFVGWHGLWGCYQLTGWTNFGNELQVFSPDGITLDWPFFESRLRSQDGTYAVLHFSLFDENGNPILYDPKSFENAFSDRFARTLFKDIIRQLKGVPSPSELATFQFQLLSRSDEPATDEQLIVFREMFLEFRQTIRDKSMPAFRRLLKK